MFHGCLVAIVTPMLEEGGVDYDALEKLIKWQLESQTNGLVVLGTTGESPTIEPDERAKIITFAVEQVNGRVPVIVGSGANSTAHSIVMTHQAMELGADAALLVTPYYNRPTQNGLFRHFNAISEAVPIPQILYNVPSRTACDLLPETVEQLAKFSNIVGIKEATGSMERLQQLFALNLDIDLLSGVDESAMEFMLRGGKGVISVAANVVPKEMRHLSEVSMKGDRESSERLNNQLKDLYKQLSVETNPIPTKWVLSQMGKIKSGIRLPLTPLAEKYHDQVRNAAQLANVQI